MVVGGFGGAVLARRGIHLLAESRRGPVELLVPRVTCRHWLPNSLFRWAAYHCRRHRLHAADLRASTGQHRGAEFAPPPLRICAAQNSLLVLAFADRYRLVFPPHGVDAVLVGLPRTGGVALGLYRLGPTRRRWSRQGHQTLALGGDHARSDAVAGALEVGQYPARVLQVLRQKRRGSHRDALRQPAQSHPRSHRHHGRRRSRLGPMEQLLSVFRRGV